MIKLRYTFLIFSFLFLSNANAELNNFQKGKNLFEDKKFNLAKFKFEQDIVFNPKNENSIFTLQKFINSKQN